MTLTRALARLALDTATDSMPESALAAARKLTLDSLACALAGWNAPGVGEVGAYCRGSRPSRMSSHGRSCRR